MSGYMLMPRESLSFAAKQVAFHVELSGDVRTRSTRTLIFRHVVLNEGECYDKDTGKFTAPVSGVYMFSASVRPKYSDKPVAASLMRGDYYVMFTCESSDTNVPCCSTAVCHLDSEDEVYVETVDDEPRSFDGGYGATFFSGALINPD
jgi:hypothetical protein